VRLDIIGNKVLGDDVGNEDLDFVLWEMAKFGIDKIDQLGDVLFALDKDVFDVLWCELQGTMLCRKRVGWLQDFRVMEFLLHQIPGYLLVVGQITPLRFLIEDFRDGLTLDEHLALKGFAESRETPVVIEMFLLFVRMIGGNAG